MSTPNDDGAPAFPRQHHSHPLHGGNIEGHPGMSIRDYFAGQALAGMTGTLAHAEEIKWSALASDCYRLADAMIEHRNKTNGGNKP